MVKKSNEYKQVAQKYFNSTFELGIRPRHEMYPYHKSFAENNYIPIIASDGMR
jgi:hypothetical protein